MSNVGIICRDERKMTFLNCQCLLEPSLKFGPLTLAMAGISVVKCTERSKMPLLWVGWRLKDHSSGLLLSSTPQVSSSDCMTTPNFPISGLFKPS